MVLYRRQCLASRCGSLKRSNKEGKDKGEVQVLLWYQDHGLVDGKQIQETSGRGHWWLHDWWDYIVWRGPLLAVAVELLLKQPPELSHPVCFVSNALHNHFRLFSCCWSCRWRTPQLNMETFERCLNVGSETGSKDDIHLVILSPLIQLFNKRLE